MRFGKYIDGRFMVGKMIDGQMQWVDLKVLAYEEMRCMQVQNQGRQTA